jgi:xanthine dehydrogenase accessory factor
MYDIADRLLAAAQNGRSLVVATAIQIDGSAPRTVGTSMAFDGSAVIGSVAGGCVEGALVDVAERVLLTGVAETVDFGIDDETAFSVGLTCGGALRVHVQLFTDAHEAALRAGTQIEVCRDFVEQPPVLRRMIIVGAMEYSAALASAATALGYRVTVCDPRSLFATAARFATSEVVVEWPTTFLQRAEIDEQTVICVLSHDWRFDAESLAIALRSPAGYVGAMGSRVTDARRRASLDELGVDHSRLQSPIGLDLGASTPEETAVSILAEILASRNGSTTEALASRTGAIHA